MSLIKWTTESLVAAAAVAITAIGSLLTTAIHWGAVNVELSSVQEHQKTMDERIDQNKEMLAEQKTHDAAVEQRLDDMIARLDRIEKKL